MQPSKVAKRFQPEWWATEHTLLWEQRAAFLRTEFEAQNVAEQRDRRVHQGPDDAVLQHHPVTPRNVDVDHAYAVPDRDWEVGTSWEQLEPALRLGVGACVYYRQYVLWSPELESCLRQDWERQHAPGTWQRVRRAVRRGFEAARKHVS